MEAVGGRRVNMAAMVVIFDFWGARRSLLCGIPMIPKIDILLN